MQATIEHSIVGIADNFGGKLCYLLSTSFAGLFPQQQSNGERVRHKVYHHIQGFVTQCVLLGSKSESMEYIGLSCSVQVAAFVSRSLLPQWRKCIKISFCFMMQNIVIFCI